MKKIFISLASLATTVIIFSAVAFTGTSTLANIERIDESDEITQIIEGSAAQQDLPILMPFGADLGGYGIIKGAYIYSERCSSKRTSRYLRNTYFKGTGQDSVSVYGCSHSNACYYNFEQVELTTGEIVWVNVNYIAWGSQYQRPYNSARYGR